MNVRNAPVPVPGGYRSPFDPVYDPFWGLAAESGVVVATHAGNDGYDALIQMWEPSGAESSLFRSPLRGVVTKNRAVSDFYATAICHRSSSASRACGWPAWRTARRGSPTCSTGSTTRPTATPATSRSTRATPSASTCGSRRSGRTDMTELLPEFRADRFLLGSDWPHAEGTREPMDFVTETLAGLPADAVQRIAKDNAVELLGLPPV